MSIGRSVSLYSLQEPYFLGKMDLEACVAAVKNQVGADGIEVLVDQMPYPSLRSEDRTMSDDDIAKFKDLMQKYQTVPTAYDTTFFTTWYAKRNMSNRETIYWTKKDMVNCARMGFPVYRTGIMRKEDIRILSECFEFAEQLGIFIATEVHTPRGIHTWWTQDFLEEVKRKNTKNAGFLLDFAVFTKGMPLADKKAYLRAGAKESILDEIDKAYRAGCCLTNSDIEKLGGDKTDIAAAEQMRRQIYDDPEWIGEILDYTKHCHGKFYEMTEDCDEPSIDYAGPIAYLKEKGWDGYISSEYEGQRHYFEMGGPEAPDPIEQLRRHHVMLKRLIGE